MATTSSGSANIPQPTLTTHHGNVVWLSSAAAAPYWTNITVNPPQTGQFTIGAAFSGSWDTGQWPDYVHELSTEEKEDLAIEMAEALQRLTIKVGLAEVRCDYCRRRQPYPDDALCLSCRAPLEHAEIIE